MQASSNASADPPRIVLKPKLQAPLPRPEHVVRRSLLDLLRNALDFKVSVISAPTGYGKTTLLAHWRQVEETNVSFAWVSLDEQDNDPIRLASLSLQNKEDKHAFIESFRGSNRYIVGLLGEEVLAGLTEEVRQFLLRTSVLRTMTGPLCEAVTGREDSAFLLRSLARSNLFVVALDEQGEWYRYHHLFSELLLFELESSTPDLVPILRRQASVWLEGAG